MSVAGAVAEPLARLQPRQVSCGSLGPLLLPSCVQSATVCQVEQRLWYDVRVKSGQRRFFAMSARKRGLSGLLWRE